MSKPVRITWILALLLAGFYPSFAQVLARAQTNPPVKTGVPAVQKSLKEVLRELKDYYKQAILYFDRNVEAFTVSADVINYKADLEQNLKKVLKATRRGNEMFA